MSNSRKVSALFVETNGVYCALDNVDPWDEQRDARRYSGPNCVVAHPPCQRWGVSGTEARASRTSMCLAPTAVVSLQRCTPCARMGACWNTQPIVLHGPGLGLPSLKRGEGWIAADTFGGHTCYVEQGHYGHFSRKPTWLYACKVSLPEMKWERLPQRLHPVALERYGYEKARRIGVMAMVGGKRKTEIRNATPPEFRDVLVSMALSGSGGCRS